ncbi:MAG: hypothetical protein ACK5IJ_07485 [Mangrovibacterium sp.]
MTGIIFIVLGCILIVIGIRFQFQLNSTTSSDDTISNQISIDKYIDMAIADGQLTKNERNLIIKIAQEHGADTDAIIADIENRLNGMDSETVMNDFNKKNGDDFEKFVALKFDKKYFTIKEWAGDKYVDGVYAQTTLQPDLLLQFKLHEEVSHFFVECKWRKSFYKSGVIVAKSDQLKRYEEFQEARQIPVFIAIGIGGTGKSPEELFILPLDALKDSFIHTNQLMKYKKQTYTNFFFDINKQLLN